MELVQLVILVLFNILVDSYSSASEPGQLQFEGNGAFIELDSQPLSCSVKSQSAFNISFDVKVKVNSTVLFVGVSGSYASDDFEMEGDPIALILYFDRPYLRLIMLRLTDHAFPFYRHLAVGYFDKLWAAWHQVSIATGHVLRSTRGRRSRMQLVYSFDSKTAKHYLQPTDLLWPSWSTLRHETIKVMRSGTRARTNIPLEVHTNEFFFGMPPEGTISRYAVEILNRRRTTQRRDGPDLQTLEALRVIVNESSKLPPFEGSVKNLLISSACDCDNSKFGPRFISAGDGVTMSSVCGQNLWSSEVSAKSDKAQSVCKLDGKFAQPCGCSVVNASTICHCPNEPQCSKKTGETIDLYFQSR